MKRVITFGTFDLLHQGHIRILERSKALGDHLIVGISTDQLNLSKGKEAVFGQDQRLAYIKALKCVDEVFFEHSLEEKNNYILEHKADLLVMGDDWKGKFDWVSCETCYLPRTEGVSSTEIKSDIFDKAERRILLFGDTYISKHYDCAVSMVNSFTDSNVIPIFTNTKELPKGINFDGIVYFNRPVMDPPKEYQLKPRILIDHGASHLKWFLANRNRYKFFDLILTAGPDHSRVLETFFQTLEKERKKSRSVGFIKSDDILNPAQYSRSEVCKRYNLDPDKPIIVFAPTWHISSNRDLNIAIENIATIDNHIASLHPETRHLDTSQLNIADGVTGVTVELMKHADCVISDTSSTIYEAAALGKPVVQILLREYADNNSVFYDFPYTAGNAELFCGGIAVRPDMISSTVDIILNKKKPFLAAIKACQKRILTGTYVDKGSKSRIITELRKACKTKITQTQRASQDTEQLEVSTAYRLNLFFASNYLIAHGAGNFKKHHASNSKEAITAALKAVDVIELDFVQAKNGVIVAHDNTEKKYGLDKPYDKLKTDRFLSSKFLDDLNPISLEDAITKCARPGKALVCDIKSTRENYVQVAKEIYRVAKEKGVLERIVIQSYCVEDFVALAEIGSIKTILAVWKYFYKDPIGDDTIRFIEKCVEINSNAIVGISIPYINHHLTKPTIEQDKFLRLFAFWKRLYIHGAPLSAYPGILRKNVGLFADAYSSKYQFRDHPEHFNWRDYLFMYPGLVDAGKDNQISSILHYLEFGNTEGRLGKYTAPPDLNYQAYVNKNPNLRKGGVSGPNSARAHWTMYGKEEGRAYK